MHRLLCLVLMALLGACAGDAPEATDAPRRKTRLGSDARRPPVKGVTLDARRPPPPETLEAIAALGATHLTLIPFGFQERPDVPAIRMHTGGGWYSETDAGIRALAQEAEARGMDLILKPHVWIGRYSADGQARHAIAFDTEAGWQAWEAQYRRFLLHYARLAEEVGAAVLVVGTELASTVRARPAFWRALIAEVRGVYGGALTYAANWYEEYQDVPFWDALDYVGVQAYFPLSEAEDPSLAQLKAGWQAHCAALEQLAARVERPVLFTEIGYRSVAYAAATPWRWPSDDETAPPDPALQARLYRAFFERVWSAPWLAGAILWKWHPASERRRPLGFSPQDKPAAAVIRQGFRAEE